MDDSAHARWRLYARPLASLVAVLLVTFLNTVATVSIQAQDMSLIAEGVRERQQRLLTFPGGVAISYTLRVHQDAAKPSFVWLGEAKGFFAVNWPQTRCRIEGQMGGIMEFQNGKYVPKTQHHVREADYNFATMTSVGREGTMLGQVLDSRHAYSAICAYPLVFQCFEQFDQRYVPGKANDTDYWLPSALTSRPFAVQGHEVVDGTECVIVGRDSGRRDRMWFAPSLGFALLKREYHSPEGVLEERLINRNHRKIDNGVFIPLSQSRECYDAKGAELFQLQLTVTDVRQGNVSDADVYVSLPDDVERFEDLTAGVSVERAAAAQDFESVVSKARDELQFQEASWLQFMAAINVFIVLGLIAWRLRRTG